MYEWLSSWLPRRAAGVALALWYTALLLAVLWCLHLDVPFRYGEI